MVGKLSRAVYTQQKMEILTALRKLGEKVSNSRMHLLRIGIFWMIQSGLTLIAALKYLGLVAVTRLTDWVL